MDHGCHRSFAFICLNSHAFLSLSHAFLSLLTLIGRALLFLNDLTRLFDSHFSDNLTVIQTIESNGTVAANVIHLPRGWLRFGGFRRLPNAAKTDHEVGTRYYLRQPSSRPVPLQDQALA